MSFIGQRSSLELKHIYLNKHEQIAIFVLNFIRKNARHFFSVKFSGCHPGKSGILKEGTTGNGRVHAANLA